MRPPRRRPALWATLGLVAVTGCSDPGAERVLPAAADTADDPAGPTSTGTPGSSGAPESDLPTRAALPGLFEIMNGLEADMARVGRGLWQEALDTVAAGAVGVAEHPALPADEAARIASVLGDEMAAFGAMDTRVHDLAVTLAERAGSGDLSGVLASEAELRQACVGCHTAFRARLRAAVR